MKAILIIISLLFTANTFAQDFQVSAMNGYSVDNPAFDVYNGNVYLVFGTNYKFYKFPEAGPSAPITDPIIPDPNNWGPYNTEIAYGQLDKLVSLYIDYKNSQFELRSVQSIDDGANWSYPNVIDTIELGSSMSFRVDLPRIKCSDKGKMYFMWFDFRNSSDVASMYFMPYNGKKTRMDLVNNTDYEYGASCFIKTVNDTDKIFITYATDNKLFFRISDDEGATFSAPVMIKDLGNTYLNYETFTHVLVDSNNKIYVAYQYFGSAGAKLITSVDNGVTWTSPVAADNEGMHYVGLKITPNNTLVKYYVTNNDLYLKSSLDGTNWSKQIKVNTTSGTVTGDFGYASFLNAKVLDDNYITFAWVDSRTGNSEIFYAKVSIPSTPTAIEDVNNIVTEYSLEQNYPNPFNPITTINYKIIERNFVTLKIYDTHGREVSKLVNEEKPAGSYSISLDASNLASGVYFYRLQAGNFVKTNKMVLLK